MHIPTEYERTKYLNRKRLGLCVKCGLKAVTGRTMCNGCSDKTYERRKARHPIICVECKKQISSKLRLEGKRLHPLCAQKRQDRRYPSQHRGAAMRYQRRHKQLGLCTHCQAKAIKGGYCLRHYAVAKERVDRAAGRI